MDMLEKGSKYSELNRSYIIFICLFDFFGKGRHIYTFENICREDTSILLGDGTAKIFLKAKGTMDDISPELKAFLDYVAGEKPDDAFVERLDMAVKKARKNRKWRHEYMTLLMRDQENREIGREEGRAEGREEGREESSKKIAFKMYEKKYPLEYIAELVEFPISTIQEWLAEAHANL